METTVANNWIALGALTLALIVQLIAAAWWLSRALGKQELSIASAVSSEREHRSRAISEHARVVASEIEKARSDARVARELIAEHKIETAHRFGEYPTKTEMRAILSDNMKPISDAMTRLLDQSPSRSRKRSP